MNRFAPAAVLLAALATAGCNSSELAGTAGGGSVTARSTPAAAAADSAKAAPSRIHRLASGLVYEDLVVGDGKMADPGLTAIVHYTGWLTDGTKFDSSYDHGQPLPFVIGAGQVIRGWDEGVRGMRIGGKRKLTVPPDLGYGAAGNGPIPPNATLIFEVSLLNVN